MEHKLINPISTIEVSDENRDRIESLMNDFDKLSEKEKFDVVELQHIMLDIVSMHNEKYGIPAQNKEPERKLSEIVEHMTPKSLDYSQTCINYYASQTAKNAKRNRQ
ncbi:MAG TPA: hypothetical protein C5S51_04895 [Methanosarcinaceae archaeon]|nr:hypothetical protein [Methanosarcinaceae archaeon]